MEEKDEVVEVKPESETPKVEEKVETAEPVNAEKSIDKQVIKRYIGIDKNLKMVFNTTIFLFVFMALRLLMGLISVGDIGTLLKFNMTETTVLGILSIIELVFAIANCVLACIYFSFINKLKKAIEKEEDVTTLLAKCKVWTKVISIVFSVFFAFEIGVLTFMLTKFEVGSVVYLSLIWSALFTFYAWYNLKLLGKLEQDIKASQNA